MFSTKKLVAISMATAIAVSAVAPTMALAAVKPNIQSQITVKSPDIQLLYQIEKQHGLIKSGIHTDGFFGLGLKIFKVALRAGGAALGEVVSWFSPTAGIWIRSNSVALANLIDSGITLAEGTLTTAIRAMGAPEDVAKEIAKLIVSLL
ncbi:hypothetical protein D3C87_604160 [compost metagenome]